MRPLALPLACLAAALAACGGSTAPLAPPPARAPDASDAWWNGAVVYEVFVRSFRDADGDGIGDLAGLREKLDYLNDGDPTTDTDLGVDAIWLMPIQPSPSTHGYDVTDYDGVNPQYGTLADLDALVAAAHARGIKVVLDFVPNHTSSEHPWFLDAASSPSAAHRDWYLWAGANPGWTRPWDDGGTWYLADGAWYYAVFWSGMPDLNWNNPAVPQELAAVAERWLARGVDGFRLDAVRYLVEGGRGLQADQPGTHAALKTLVGGIRAIRPDALVVGEAWADTATIATYYGATDVVAGGDELPLTLDFPIASATISSVSNGTAEPLASALDAVAREYPSGAADAPFLSNHDQTRLATALGGDPARLRLAAAILLTLQGTPFVYYGEELGTANGSCAGDECKRTPMAWDATANAGFSAATPWWPLAPGADQANVAAETAAPSSVLSRYRQLIRVRKASPALRTGGTQRLLTGRDDVLAWLRTGADEQVLVVHGLGRRAATIRLDAPGTTAEALLADSGAAIAPATGGGFDVTVPAAGSGVWRLR